MPATVQLTDCEFSGAYAIGVKRHALRLGRNEELACNARVGDRWNNNGIGAVAEYATALYLSRVFRDFSLLRDWAENRSYSEDHRNAKLIPCDVGRNVQVKCTRHPAGGMILHRYDNGDFTYVFVRVNAQTQSCELVGWEQGDRLMVPGYWNPPERKLINPAWFVPADVLRPIDTLPREEVFR